MAYVEWNDGLSVDQELLDGQHRQLIGLINQLHDAMLAGQGTQVLGDTIDGLIAYTRTHFDAEECCFDATGYPDAAAHKEQHREFVAKVTDFRRGLEEGRLMLTLDVMDFLSEWLVAHIKGSDRSYAPYLTH